MGTELVQQAAADLAEGGGSSQRPGAVDPGSFLALILRTVARGPGGLALDHAWASNQAATFILAGRSGERGAASEGCLHALLPACSDLFIQGLLTVLQGTKPPATPLASPSTCWRPTQVRGKGDRCSWTSVCAGC